MPRLPPQLSAVSLCQTPLDALAASGKAAGALIGEPGDLPSTRSAPGGVLRFCVPLKPALRGRPSHPWIRPVERGDLPQTAPSPAEAEAAPAPTSAAPAAPAATIFICTTCRASDSDTAALAGGALLAEAATAACPDGVAVKGVRCLANCKRALSAAIVRPDGWTYVFGDLTPGAAADLIAGARLLADAPEGVMPWRGRPDSLKRGMVARIPPLTFTEEM